MRIARLQTVVRQWPPPDVAEGRGLKWTSLNRGQESQVWWGGGLYSEVQYIKGNGQMAWGSLQNRITDKHTSKNITFSQLRWRVSKNIK